MSRTVILLLGVVFLCQVGLLAAAGWSNRYDLHGDAVSYVRIASYYANGQTDLAINGYWGPMLSWLIAPLLRFCQNPFYAARIASGVSAMVFLLGSISVFRRLELPGSAVVLGACIVALASVHWSVETTTPDLLVGGLICFGASQLLSPSWPASRAKQFAAGLLFGVAYLAKAPALPVFLVMAISVSATWVVCGQARFRTIVTNLLVTLCAFTIVAGPWIAALSLKYDTFVFSTTARIAHAIAGPNDIDRRRPMVRNFYAPEPGRITCWEDPSSMPYEYWSPFANSMYMKHQLELVYRNSERITEFLSGFDWLHMGLFVVVAAFVFPTPWRKHLMQERWRWAAIAVFSICVVYLPVYAGQMRYYYATLPFLFAASVQMAISLTQIAGGARSFSRLIGIVVVCCSFLVPNLARVVWVLPGQPKPPWLILSQQLEDKGVNGAIAADTDAGVYLGLVTDQVSYGYVPDASVGQYRRSQARLIILQRSSPAAKELGQDEGFQDLDAILFESKIEAGAFPLKVYRRIDM